MTLAIQIELLARRYTATRFNDRNVAEWPPHPARLFSAAVALWAEGDPRSEAEETVLRWLERQPAPEIACGAIENAFIREGTTHFVPVNDAGATPSIDATYAMLQAAHEEMTNLEERASREPVSKRERTRALKAVEKAVARVERDSLKANDRALTSGALTVLPDERMRQPRTFPSVCPDDPSIVFLWPHADPGPEQRAVLDRLLARIGRLGHSSSLVACRVIDAPCPPATLVPDELGSIAIRVPGPGQFDLLEQEFSRHRGIDPRALPAAMQPYREARSTKPNAPHPVFSNQFAVLELDGAVSIRGSLVLARALRSALVGFAGGDAPEMLTGRRPAAAPASTEPTDRAHAAIVPLPFAGHRHADSMVRGVALVTPHDRDREREAVLRLLSGWLGYAGGKLKVGAREVTLNRGPGLATVATLRPDRWCAESTTWGTVTPIALDRWPGDLHAVDPSRRSAAFGRAAELVALACAHIGLPRPLGVEVRPDAFVSGVPPAHRFPPFRTPNGGPNRPLVHALVRFDPEATGPVAGPVLLGAGRYVGQGLCLPLDRRVTRESGVGGNA